MAITLAEAQKRAQNPLLTAIIKTFLAEWPILRNASILGIQGNAVTINRETTLPTTAWRAINGTIADSSQVVTPVTFSLKILAGLLKVDEFLLATTPGLAQQELAAQIKALALGGNLAIFKGDSSGGSNQPDGLQVQCVANGSEITNDGAGNALSLARLYELVVKTQGSNKVIYCNETIYLRLLAAASDPTLTNISRSVDQFGNPVLSVGGARVEMAGETAAGTQVLPFDEGVGTDETSVYCVAHGDGGFQFLNNTNAANGDQLAEFGVRVRPRGNNQFAETTEFEWYMCPAIFEKRSVYRLKAIKDLPAVKA